MDTGVLTCEPELRAPRAAQRMHHVTVLRRLCARACVKSWVTCKLVGDF